MTQEMCIVYVYWKNYLSFATFYAKICSNDILSKSFQEIDNKDNLFTKYDNQMILLNKPTQHFINEVSKRSLSSMLWLVKF